MQFRLVPHIQKSLQRTVFLVSRISGLLVYLDFCTEVDAQPIFLVLCEERVLLTANCIAQNCSLDPKH